MNKEDYMHLPKKVLVSLLLERDTTIRDFQLVTKSLRTSPASIPDCFHGGPCINPLHDCVNCPHLDSGGVQYEYATSTSLTLDKDK